MPAFVYVASYTFWNPGTVAMSEIFLMEIYHVWEQGRFVCIGEEYSCIRWMAKLPQKSIRNIFKSFESLMPKFTSSPCKWDDVSF